MLKQNNAAYMPEWANWPKWIVRQGSSTFKTPAPNIDAARIRAAHAGFRRPESIVLDSTETAEERKSAISYAIALHRGKRNG